MTDRDLVQMLRSAQMLKCGVVVDGQRDADRLLKIAELAELPVPKRITVRPTPRGVAA